MLGQVSRSASCVRNINHLKDLFGASELYSSSLGTGPCQVDTRRSLILAYELESHVRFCVRVLTSYCKALGMIFFVEVILRNYIGLHEVLMLLRVALFQEM